jgi:hypothetical protein
MRRRLLDSIRSEERERRNAPEQARDQAAIDRRLREVQHTSTLLGWQSWRVRAARVRRVLHAPRG